MKKKSTHTLDDLEKLKFEYANKLQDSATIEESKEFYKKMKEIDKLISNIHEKKNGAHRPQPYKSDVPMDVPALMKLIDSVEDGFIPREGTAMHASYVNTIKQYRENYDESLWLPYRMNN